MFARGFVEAFLQRWCRFDQGLHLRILAVQNTQRVAVQTPATVIVEIGQVIAKIGHQQVAVTAPAFGRAEAVELKFDVPETQPLPEAFRQQDQLILDVVGRV